jgi:DNA repair exonuclease SbcCD nuclease subunit
MGGDSFRFIHAGEFHLERPLGGLDGIPPRLREALVDAPWQAAEAVFQTALQDRIDFLILTGDLLHPIAAGARGLAFLIEHFEQLGEHGIPVYWCTGQVDDPERWPEGVDLPANVHRFSRTQVETLAARRNGTQLASISGRSCDGRQALHVPAYRREAGEDFAIAVGFGQVDAALLTEPGFDFWCLGGSHAPRELIAQRAYQCGSTQARGLDESGAHGFYRVDVGSDGGVRTHFIDSDVFRYEAVDVDLGEGLGERELREVMSHRIGRLQHDHGQRHLLLKWTLRQTTTERPVAAGAGDIHQSLAWLRSEFGHGQPAAWSLGLTIEPPARYPTDWQEEDTILGDFLRAAAKLKVNGGRELAFDKLAAGHAHLDRNELARLTTADAEARRLAVSRATLLGVDLLRGGKPQLVVEKS